MTTPADILSAARASVLIPLKEGTRPGDPLTAMITGDTWQGLRPAIEALLGRTLDLTGKVPAPYMRAALRRHVAHGVLK